MVDAPNVPLLFFGFRLMVLFAFVLLAVFSASLWYTAREAHAPRLLRLAVLVVPLPRHQRTRLVRRGVRPAALDH